MATNKVLKFEEIPIDNEKFFITDVPKDIVDAMAQLIFPSIQKHIEKSE